MSSLTCSACKFYEPQPANHLHGEGYGVCRHKRRGYRDYLGDGSSLTVQPIAHHADAACPRFEATAPEPQQASLFNDNVVRRMAHEASISWGVKP